MKILIGHTGFVGSNLLNQTKFDSTFNSTNIADSFGSNPDQLVFAGIRAEKFLANKEPVKDRENILEAIENIKKINPRSIVLISTIDVYKTPINVNENSSMELDGLHPYGLNRYELETWVENNINNHLIIRLPGLYGKNIKKNFIYDLINLIPSMLNENKYLELSVNSELIQKYYVKQENGFFKCIDLTLDERKTLKKYFNEIGFSALNFTDSRGIFQFYNLANLWNHISIALENKIKKINLATEPVEVSEIYRHINKSEFINEISDSPPKYDFKTKYSDIFKGNNGYILDKNYILNDIKNFVEENLT